MDTTTAEKSFDRVKTLIISIGLASLVIIALSTWLIYKLFHWTRVNEWKLIAAAALATVIVWAAQSWLLYSTWKAGSYDIGAEFVTVKSSQGIFKIKTTSYRYESMISVSMNQGFMGKAGAFSEIHIKIPKLDKEVVLRDLRNPELVMQTIQGQLNKRSANTHTLVN